MSQPQLGETLETLAELFWPEVWAFWLDLKKMSELESLDVFEHVLKFVSRADDDTISALRLFRLSTRYGKRNALCRDAFLDPLLVIENGQKWDGVGPWLNRVLDKCTDNSVYCFMACTDAARPFLANEATASRLVPLLSRITLADHKWANPYTLVLFSGIRAVMYCACPWWIGRARGCPGLQDACPHYGDRSFILSGTLCSHA